MDGSRSPGRPQSTGSSRNSRDEAQRLLALSVRLASIAEARSLSSDAGGRFTRRLVSANLPTQYDNVKLGL
jgi:hypothetical protein